MMRRHDLGDDCWVDHDKDWLAEDEADALLQHVLVDMPWERRPIVVFGKEVLQPRLIAWAGEVPYKYSGQTLCSRPLEGALGALCQAVSQVVGVSFNHVLLNRYRDGRDNMAFHCDNEPELGRNPTIAAISLGARRKFLLRRKDRNRKRHFSLAHGSLLVMGGAIQHRWRHAVPKHTGLVEERVNLTFRWLKGPPGWREWRDDVLPVPARSQNGRP